MNELEILEKRVKQYAIVGISLGILALGTAVWFWEGTTQYPDILFLILAGFDLFLLGGMTTFYLINR